MTVFTRIVAISSRIIVASALSLPTAWAEDSLGEPRSPRQLAIPPAKPFRPPIQRPTYQPALRHQGRAAKVNTCCLNYATPCASRFAKRLLPMTFRQIFLLL